MNYNRFPDGKKRNRVLFALQFLNLLLVIFASISKEEFLRIMICIILLGCSYTTGLFTDLREGL